MQTDPHTPCAMVLLLDSTLFNAGLTVPFLIKWAVDSSSTPEPKQPPTLQEVRAPWHLADSPAYVQPACVCSIKVISWCTVPAAAVGMLQQHTVSSILSCLCSWHHLLQMIAAIKEKNSPSTA
jgi:hypothetical protein